MYITSCAEEDALAWAARTFAQRAGLNGSARPCSLAGKTASGLTTGAAKAAESALCDALASGDGATMSDHAAVVATRWGNLAMHAELGRLTALTWAAHVLGHRLSSGDFANTVPCSIPPSPPEPPTSPYEQKPMPEKPLVRPDSAARYLEGRYSWRD